MSEFPQLSFHLQPRQDLSELVYCAESYSKKVLDGIQSTSESTGTESESTDDSDILATSIC